MYLRLNHLGLSLKCIYRQLVNQIWLDRCEINRYQAFDLMVATTHRGFDLSDKQNDRIAVYCSLSPCYYVLFIA
jgi:hypothetical protein